MGLNFLFATSLFLLVASGSVSSQTPVLPNEFPFLVSIQYQHWQNLTYSHQHTGVILDASHVITGSISHTDVAGSYRVVAGITNLDNIDDPDTDFQFRNLSKATEHPEYCYNLPLSVANNLMILRLAEPLQFSEKVQAIPLSKEGVDLMANATLIGWVGKDPLLRKAEMPLFPYEACSLLYGRFNWASGRVCAGFLTDDGNALDINPGFDKGHPLICREAGGSGSPTLCGVFSMHRLGIQLDPLKRIGFPMVYSSVISFGSWINETVTENTN